MKNYYPALASWMAKLTAWRLRLGQFRDNRPADFWHALLFASFWLTIALFPIGYGWREVMPSICFIFLLCYYHYAWPQSVLKRLTVWWLFIPLGMMIIIGVVFSIHPWNSLLHAGTGINKAYILPFIGMECVRNGQDLRRLVWAFVFCCFWSGLNGLWQACTGYDFIMKYPLNAGRLTGSIGDYAMGNCLALAMVPAFAVIVYLKKKLGIISGLFTSLALFWPAFFLLNGASTRSSILAIAGVLAVWAFTRYGWHNWRVVIFPVLVLALFMFFQPERMSVQRMTGDNRWDLWSLAWQVFLTHPWLGAGAGQYNAAFQSLGLAPQKEAITISHPHDVYLDMLYAHGIIGFSLGMLFIAGFLIWGYRHIRPAFLAEYETNSDSSYWRVTIWLWLGYVAWLINGIFGHDFYRTWWLAEAMATLGIMTGAIVNAPAGCQAISTRKIGAGQD